MPSVVSNKKKIAKENFVDIELMPILAQKEKKNVSTRNTNNRE